MTMYELPYGNTQQLNLDWFIKRWKEFYEEWEQTKTEIDGALDEEVQKVEDAMEDLYAARDAAAASATAAAASATSASNDATIAANAATAAAASATLANTKATAAGLSEAAAALSASQAANDATAAATSASQASASASSATDSAQAAAASATAADSSADDAADSATAAAGSASDAADSATAAAASAASLVVDSAMSDSSTNPVQNKVINGELTELKTALTTVIKSDNDAYLKSKKIVKLDSVEGRYYGGQVIDKYNNIIIVNQTYAGDNHRYNLTGTTLSDKNGASNITYAKFPQAYLDDIPEFIIGHIYRIHLYAFDGTYTLSNPAAQQFCFLNFGDKQSVLKLTDNYPNNSIFYCATKPQAIFFALRAGTYNCKIGFEIIDITEETAQPTMGKNLLQIFDKITGIGDSLMCGYTSSTNPATDSETAKARKANWLSYFGSDIGRDITNLAVGSSSWKNWRYGTGNTDITDADIDTNCYLVGLGVNDSEQGNTVGTTADIATDKANNADSVYGNADFVIRTLHGYNENAHIFVFTSPVSATNSDDINDAIRYIANLYSYVHCIDIDALYRNDFSYGAISKTLNGTHYNPLGYRIIANYIESAIDSFMLSNYSKFLKVPYQL